MPCRRCACVCSSSGVLHTSHGDVPFFPSLSLPLHNTFIICIVGPSCLLVFVPVFSTCFTSLPLSVCVRFRTCACVWVCGCVCVLLSFFCQSLSRTAPERFGMGYSENELSFALIPPTTFSLFVSLYFVCGPFFAFPLTVISFPLSVPPMGCACFVLFFLRCVFVCFFGFPFTICGSSFVLFFSAFSAGR